MTRACGPGRRRRRLVAALGFGAAGATGEATALGQEAPLVRACVDASEEAQTLRDHGKFEAARQKLLFCARVECPRIVRKDCLDWMAALEGRLATIVFAGRDAAGRDVTDVRVSVDGVALAERLDGRAVTVDPGEHLFRFDSGAAPPIEMRIVVREGEKQRLVTIPLGRSESRSSPSGPAPIAAPAPSSGTSSVPTLTYVFGGVAALGLGAFAYLWATAVARFDELDRTCAPQCAEADLSELRTRVMLADVSLGVGIVAAGAAVGVYLFRPKGPSGATALRFSPRGLELAHQF